MRFEKFAGELEDGEGRESAREKADRARERRRMCDGCRC